MKRIRFEPEQRQPTLLQRQAIGFVLREGALMIGSAKIGRSQALRKIGGRSTDDGSGKHHWNAKGVKNGTSLTSRTAAQPMPGRNARAPAIEPSLTVGLLTRSAT